MAENVFSGPKCIIKLGKDIVGFGTNIEATVNQDLARVPVLGDVHSKQIEVVGITVSVSMGMIRIRNNPNSDVLGGSPENMGMMGRGTTADIISHPSYTLVAFDQTENEPLFIVEGCKLSSHNVSVDARGIAGQNVSLEGIRMGDENA